jgi:hypothetical protein
MPEGHETREIFLINEMCIKAHRSRNVDSLQKAISAAREQGLGQSIICLTCESLLQNLNKKQELHEASEQSGEWQHWAERNEEPFEQTFRNWAVGETRLEGDASSKRTQPALERTGSNRLVKELRRDQLPFIPETTAFAASSWEQVTEEGRVWLVDHMDESTAACKWL